MANWTEEADLRAWLRKAWANWRPPLIWIEAAHGGTLGAPDVIIPLGGDRYVPVELKLGESKKSIVTFYVRPAQRKLHGDLSKAGCRSAFLIGTQEEIFAVRSSLVLDGGFVGDKRSMSSFAMSQVKSVEHLLEIFRDKRFW